MYITNTIHFIRLIGALVITLCSISAYGQKTDNTLIAAKDWKQKGLWIPLDDQLKHPKMNWPITRLQYHLDLSENGIEEGKLQLIKESTGETVPFQLSHIIKNDGLITKATLHFLTELPSGGSMAFRLAPKAVLALDPDTPVRGVKITESANSIEMDNGKIRVQLPLSGNPSLPPIAKLGDGSRWLSKGEFSNNSVPISLSVTEGSMGPVMAEYHLAYQLKGNKKYLATLRLTAEMDFFELEEEMLGFTTEDSLSWKLIWDHFEPGFRFTPNRPGGPIDNKKRGFDNFEWEPIAGKPADPESQKHPMMPYDQQLGTNSTLPFRILPYDNWLSWWNLPTATFWDKSQEKSIGIFIKDMEKWDDQTYALWTSNLNLGIHFTFHNNTLAWHLPLSNGTRSTAMSIYPHQKDIDLVANTNIPLMYTDFLRRWYGWISLDKVKNWELDYPQIERLDTLFFTSESKHPQQDITDLERILGNKIANISENSERNNGPTPVGSRDFHDKITPMLYANYKHIPDDKIRTLRAQFLFMTYVFMDEALMPMKNMLSGHPNFLADIKAVPGLAAALYKQHPQAQVMADHFEKSVALNLRYHVRPTVAPWNATGGRWTENLGTYTWAFLKPTLRTSYLLHHHFDDRNRLLQPNISLYAGWLLKSLTSPLLSADNNRVHPPQGAHSHGLTPSNLLRMLGQEIYYYDPLLAEQLLFVTSPNDLGFEYKIGRVDPWDKVIKGDWKYNTGTNPRLKSEKFTGYGLVLRKNFGEKNEMYVHLQQIDDGPNYRWGRAAKGGNGVIYYYANGKRFSHNGMEDVGDAPFGDVERSTNFGIKKQGTYRDLGPYRSVGRNDLTEPLFDFGSAQYAQINANAEVQPDYISRSVLQSSDDYMVVFDHVKDNKTEGRFAWFVGKEDNFPFIHQLKPGAKGQDSEIKPSKSRYHNDKGELATKGRYYDGQGSFLTVVTHKNDVVSKSTDYGCTVENSNFKDWVYRASTEKAFSQNGVVFKGTAGVVRYDTKIKSYQASLFHGQEIGIPGIDITFQMSGKNGVSVHSSSQGFEGLMYITQPIRVAFKLTKPLPQATFYLNGEKVAPEIAGSLAIDLLPGKYNWQWSTNGLIPGPAKIVNTIYHPNGSEVEWQKVAGATAYQLEVSTDIGTSWTKYGEPLTSTKTFLKGFSNKTKVHVRVLAKGTGGWGLPSSDYPVYFTDQAPHAPEGLLVRTTDNKTHISWGQVLGVSRYKLYRRKQFDTAKEPLLIYAGTGREYQDTLPTSTTVYEYWVTAENKNGVSHKSIISDTDPARLINWHPKPNEIFRRDTRNHEGGYDEYNPFIEEKLPVLSYPNHPKEHR